MHLLHLSPEFLDERMKVRDFLISCAWIDAYYESMKER